MKMVFTNDPGSNGMLHLEERKYIPEGWDVVIADMKALKRASPWRPSSTTAPRRPLRTR